MRGHMALMMITWHELFIVAIAISGMLAVLESMGCRIVVVHAMRPNSNPSAAVSRKVRAGMTEKPVMEHVREAMMFSEQGRHNITAAQGACDLWKSVLQPANASANSVPSLPDRVRVLSLGMYAACLVRIGQDEKALGVIDEALSVDGAMELVGQGVYWNDLVLAKALSLQRLTRYQAAKEEFKRCIDGECRSEVALCGAALCCMRLGDVEDARQILRNGCDLVEGERAVPKARIMLSILNSLLDRVPYIPIETSEYRLVQMWARLVLGDADTPDEEENDPLEYMDAVSFNVGPFDDPLLAHLDDKVLLHKMLISKTSSWPSYWPFGFIVPSESPRIKEATVQKPHSSWFLKHRSGYGSHGNQILQFKDPDSLEDLALTQDYLLQQMVENPLLLDGYKFSMRVYVVYFLQRDVPDVYLCENGLVKFAAVPYQTHSTDSNIHMTNSGRTVSSKQVDFDFLQTKLAPKGQSIDRLLQDISTVVHDIFVRFRAHTNRISTEDPERTLMQSRNYIAKLAAPKILGLDFVVDDTGKPWLVEVNRFPGLEPRQQDASIKYQVIRAAWALAYDRHQVRLSNAFDEERTRMKKDRQHFQWKSPPDDESDRVMPTRQIQFD